MVLPQAVAPDQVAHVVGALCTCSAPQRGSGVKVRKRYLKPLALAEMAA